MSGFRSLKPVLQQVTAVAPNIPSLVISEGWVEGGIQEPYVPMEGETLETNRNNPYLVWIIKDEKRSASRFPIPVLETSAGPLRLPAASRWICR